MSDSHDKLGNNGSFFFPCVSDMPPLTLGLGNGTATYSADQLKGGTDNPELCKGVLRGNNETMGNVGAAFFKKQFVVFDYKEPAIRYAPHT
ncbi:MAG: hypothetical protein Q9213_000778 [Squamulea squamosa]